MSAALGTPEGGISQPTSGRRLKRTIAAANAFERMRPGSERIVLPPE
jgi:hypothetical protein